MFAFFLSLPLLAQIILTPIVCANALALLFVMALIPRGIVVTLREERALRRAREAGGAAAAGSIRG